LGRAISAIGDNEETAKIFGIDTKKIIGRTAFLSGAIAGLSGIIIGFDTGLKPTFGTMIVYKGIAANIIGGIGNLPLSALTSIILGITENFGTYILNSQWRDLIVFLLMIIFMYCRSLKNAR
jgi:branched-chain amino acid transport system permease protein